jgi:MFS family permease
MLSFMLPSFVFSLFGGVIADRMHKKSIMIASQILNFIATSFLAYIIFSEQITFWHFIYFGLFNGTVLSFSMPARSAVIPEVVGQKYLVNAMALQSATWNISRILGPTLAGVMIAMLAGGDTSSTREVGIVFFVIAGLYLMSVAATFMLNYQGAPHERGKATMLEDVIEGFTYMRDEKLILGLLIMGFVPMTFGWSASFLMPAFNQDVIHGGPADLGLMMTAMGVGALCGSLALARLGDIGGKGRILFFTSYCWAASLALFAISPNLIYAMAFGAISGLFSSIFGSMNMSIVQLAIRPEIRGRVMAIMMMAHGLMPLGIIPVSAIAEFVGIGSALLFSAVMLALSMFLIGYWFPMLKRIDQGYGPNALRE